MAKNTKPQKETTPRGPGRPPRDPNADPKAPILKALQGYTDRILLALIDNPDASFAGRARRAARVGIPRATMDGALDAFEQALVDARQAVADAYAAPAAPPERRQRVTLTA